MEKYATTRREFLLVGGATALTPFVPTAAAQRRRDAVLAELAEQQARLTARAVRGPIVRGEVLRQQAALLRVLAAHGSAVSLDARVARALRSADGRAAILAHRTPDLATLAGNLKAQGYDIGDVSQLPAVAGGGDRAAALARLERDGARATLVEMAATLERAGARLDQLVGVQVVRQMDCQGLALMRDMLEIWMAVFCGPWAWAVVEICVIVTAQWVAYASMSLMFC